MEVVVRMGVAARLAAVTTGAAFVWPATRVAPMRGDTSDTGGVAVEGGVTAANGCGAPVTAVTSGAVVEVSPDGGTIAKETGDTTDAAATGVAAGPAGGATEP